jgi:hypothetical protein
MKFLKNIQININKFNIKKITLIQIYIAILLLGIIFHVIKHINRYLNINPFFNFKANLFRGKIIEGFEEEEIITVGSSDKSTKEVTIPDGNWEVDSTPVNKQDPNWPDTFDATIDGNILTVTRTDWTAGWGQQLELKITKKKFKLEPICKDYNHSVDVNKFDNCDSNIRNIIKSKLLTETDYGGITIPSGFENNVDWCTNDPFRYKIKDIDKPKGKCFKDIIKYVQDKCWKYHKDNITNEDESIKNDAQEAKYLADEFRKIRDKKTSIKECGIPYDPNIDLT